MVRLLLRLLFFFILALPVLGQTTYSLSGGNGSGYSNGKDIQYSCSPVVSGTKIALGAEHTTGSNQVKFYVYKRVGVV